MLTNRILCLTTVTYDTRSQLPPVATGLVTLRRPTGIYSVAVFSIFLLFPLTSKTSPEARLMISGGCWRTRSGPLSRRRALRSRSAPRPRARGGLLSCPISEERCAPWLKLLVTIPRRIKRKGTIIINVFAKQKLQVGQPFARTRKTFAMLPV